MAKEQKQQEVAPNPDDVEVQEPPKSYRLYISLGFVSLILFQMIVLWLILPSGTAARGPGGLNPVNGVGDFEGVSGVPPGVRTTERVVEIPIDEGSPFTVKGPRNDANETFTVRIVVQVRRADERNFNRQYEARMFEIHDRINDILDGSTIEQRQEAGLTTIKERLRRGINEVIGPPLVLQVFLLGRSFESQ